MSRTGPLSTAELELLEVVVVEVSPSPGVEVVEVVEASAVVLLEPAAAVVTAHPAPLENPVATAPPPPQAVASRTTAARETRMRPSF